MNDSIHAALASWSTFYQIAGAAAAALTGLQFVVQTLIGSASISAMFGPSAEDGIAAFGTPTVVHFSVALVLSAVLSAPWPGYTGLRIALGMLGMGALVYSLIVLRRATSQRAYQPGVEDWVFHIILPSAAYAGVLVAAVFFADGDAWPHFLVAAATLLLLCVGIHNAWDTVTYLTIKAARAASNGESTPPAAPKKQKQRSGRRS